MQYGEIWGRGAALEQLILECTAPVRQSFIWIDLGRPKLLHSSHEYVLRHHGVLRVLEQRQHEFVNAPVRLQAFLRWGVRPRMVMFAANAHNIFSGTILQYPFFYFTTDLALPAIRAQMALEELRVRT